MSAAFTLGGEGLRATHREVMNRPAGANQLEAR
jgi:hypothetical protein